MAEIASAYLSLIPSLRGASRVIQGELDPLARRSGQRFGNDFGNAAGRGAGDGLSDGLSEGAGGGQEAGSKFGKLFGVAAGATASLGLGAALVDGTTKAMDQEVDLDRVAASLGLGERQAAALGRTAGNLYRDNFGESFGDSANAVGAVKAAFRDLDGGELRRVSGLALSFADIFESDVPRTISVARTAVKSGMAKDVTGALDLLTAASSKVGPALAPDIQDAVEEYGQFFNAVGIGGPEAFSLLVAGADKGTYGIDKAGDAIKEFTIRATDDSMATRTALEDLGLDFTRIPNQLLAGGEKAGRATQQIVRSLLDVKDPTKQATLALALFGTPLEDLGTKNIPEFLQSLADGGRQLGKFEGAAQRASDTLGNNARGRVESFRRDLEQTFVDVLGGRVLPVIDTVTGKLQDGFRADGLDGVAASLEDITGLDGVIVPIFEDVQDAVGDVVRIGTKLAPAFGDAAENLAPLVSPIALVGDGLELLADIVEVIPDDVASFALQAGAVLLVMKKLSGPVGAVTTSVGRNRAAFQQWRAEMTYAETRAQRTATMMGRLGTAAKGAAGIGGMLALTNASGESEGALKTLGEVGGLALLGFAVGGPIGGAIGASIGLLKSVSEQLGITSRDYKLAEGVFESVSGFESAQEGADSLREALRGVVNEYGNTTRAAVEAAFFKDGELSSDIKQLRDLGVSMSTIVSATLGQGNAQDYVNRALGDARVPLERNLASAQAMYEAVQRGYKEVSAPGQGTQRVQFSDQEIEDAERAYSEASDALATFNATQNVFSERIQKNTGELTNHRQVVRQTAQDLGITVAQYQKFPRSVRTRIEGNLPQTSQDAVRLLGEFKGLQRFSRIRTVVSAPGVDLTERQVERLGQTYKLTPKQVTTLMKIEGVGPAAKDVRTVIRQAEALSEVKPDFRQAMRSFDTFTGDAGEIVRRGGLDIVRDLAKTTGKAKADTSGVNRSLNSGTREASGIAYRGGLDVGNQLEAGIISGFATTEQRLSSNAAAAVTSAIRAAHQAADSHSPSRKMHYLGRMLGVGGANGIEDEIPRMAKAGRDLALASLAGMAKLAGARPTLGVGVEATSAAATAAQRDAFVAAAAPARAARATAAELRPQPAGAAGGIRSVTVVIGEEEFEGYLREVYEDSADLQAGLVREGWRSR
ncbi:hypothetical protein GCM10023340_08550 [Nocardioides marinquilinus]|uniref:Phage tail tape measure protein domain-containing protein n=1 Tax=Nocardioides marinquilinus TaxID=1210400 RepID=A0ABP9PA82_9ACTN